MNSQQTTVGERRLTGSHRLRNPGDFQDVFDGCQRRASHQNLLVLALSRADKPPRPARLGMVVSKKNVRRAVDRNRVKRLIREYFRLYVAPTLTNLDCVVLVRHGIERKNNDEIVKILKSRFDSLKPASPAVSQS